MTLQLASQTALFFASLPLVSGAKRAAGHKFDHSSSDGESSSEEEVLALARAAKAEGRLVILVSLGTVITGDHVDYGWKAHCSIDGEKRGLSGKENFRAVSYVEKEISIRRIHDFPCEN